MGKLYLVKLSKKYYGIYDIGSRLYQTTANYQSFLIAIYNFVFVMRSFVTIYICNSSIISFIIIKLCIFLLVLFFLQIKIINHNIL